MAKTVTKLAFKEKLGYGLGDTASHFVWDMVGFWILIFYTDTFGISAAAAGTIMLIARIWDMINDPLMGVISDRTTTRWGKFRPYILFAAVPYAVLAVLTFSTPDLNQTGKVIWAGVTYLLLMTAYTAINLPYSSLMAVMTSDSTERAGINIFRFISAFSGQLIVTGLALTMAIYFGKGDFTTQVVNQQSRGGVAEVINGDSIHYQLTPGFVGIDTLHYAIRDEKEKVAEGIAYVVVKPSENDTVDYGDAVMAFDSTAIKAKKKSAGVIPYPLAREDVHHIDTEIVESIIDVQANDNLVDKGKGYQYTVMVLGFLSVVFFLITFFSTKERVEPQVIKQQSVQTDLKNLLNNRPWVIVAVVGIVSFVMFALQNLSIAYYFKYYIGTEENVQLFNVVSSIALIVGLPIAKPLAKRFGNRNVFMGSTILSGIFFALLYIPEAGDYTLIYIFNILAKFAYAPAVVLLWTMLADTADYSEWKTGQRATGLIFSAATFGQKAGWGIGGALAGWLLVLFNFEANAVQTEETISGIKLMVSVIPGILYMSCAALLFFYTIDKKTSLQMQADLEKRRAQDNNE